MFYLSLDIKMQRDTVQQQKEQQKEQQQKIRKDRHQEDKPRPPKTAFAYFSDEYRESVRNESNTVLTVVDISKKLGKIWRSLSDEEKLKYQNIYIAERERYVREKQIYESRSQSNSIEKNNQSSTN